MLLKRNLKTPQGHLFTFSGPPYSIRKKLKVPQFLLHPPPPLQLKLWLVPYSAPSSLKLVWVTPYRDQTTSHFILLFCHTQWITSRIKTIINRLINIKFKICALLERSNCGGEISEKPSLWGIDISALLHHASSLSCQYCSKFCKSSFGFK